MTLGVTLGRGDRTRTTAGFNASSFVGIAFDGAVGNTATGNTIDGGNNPMSIGVEFKNSTYSPPHAVPMVAANNLVNGNSFFEVGADVNPGSGCTGTNIVTSNVFVPVRQLPESSSK